MVIPKSRYDEFERLWAGKYFSPYLRYGQAFYNFMDFHKTQDPEVEDIYNADYPTVKKWIEARLDHLH